MEIVTPFPRFIEVTVRDHHGEVDVAQRVGSAARERPQEKESGKPRRPGHAIGQVHDPRPLTKPGRSLPSLPVVHE
jgi:hypothetical protein